MSKTAPPMAASKVPTPRQKPHFLTSLQVYQTTGKNIPAPAGFSIFDASYISALSQIRYILLPYNFETFLPHPFITYRKYYNFKFTGLLTREWLQGKFCRIKLGLCLLLGFNNSFICLDLLKLKFYFLNTETLLHHRSFFDIFFLFFNFLFLEF